MDTSPVSASVLVGSIFITAIAIRGLLAPISDRTTKGAPEGYTKGDMSGLFAAAVAVSVIATFSYWAAPKLASIRAENDVIPDAGWAVIGYCLVAVSALNVVRGLYVKYMMKVPDTHRGVSDGTKTVNSIVHTTVGALAGCLAVVALAS